MVGLVVILFLISLVLFIPFSGIRKIFPSYNITTCFIEDLGSLTSFSSSDKDKIQVHANATLCFLILLNFAQNLSLMACVYKLR